MLIIISDSHDNLINLDQVIAFAVQHQAEAIIHCGDLCNGDTLNHLAQSWTKPVYLARGNGELYDSALLKNYPQIINLGRQGGIFIINNIKIGACHEPNRIDNLLADNPDYIFYGHTHTPWQEKSNDVELINPGNLDGSRYQATFATLDTKTKKLTLVLVNSL